MNRKACNDQPFHLIRELEKANAVPRRRKLPLRPNPMPVFPSLISSTPPWRCGDAALAKPAFYQSTLQGDAP